MLQTCGEKNIDFVSSNLGLMPGKFAIVQTHYQKGRVFLFAVHPEVSPKTSSMLIEATEWVKYRPGSKSQNEELFDKDRCIITECS